MQGEFEHDEVHSDGADGQVGLIASSTALILLTALALLCQCTPDELIQKANGSLITCRTPLDMPMARRHWIDTEITVQGSLPEVRRSLFPRPSCEADLHFFLQVKKGVKFGEGDGTVPLLSLGAMCVRGWKDPNSKWNPGGVKVITKGR